MYNVKQFGFAKGFTVFITLSFMVALSACGSSSGSTPSSLSGKWLANTAQSGVTIQVILNLMDSSDSLSGTMEVGTGGFTSPMGNLQGTRSGNEVSIRPPLFSTSFPGTLSGNRMTFATFAAYKSVTFVKQ